MAGVWVLGGFKSLKHSFLLAFTFLVTLSQVLEIPL
jgi:hypothetical protein